MKDHEFFELLNLYLDHEISAADAARLEAEVQSNASRRRTYQEYCRMQKACTLLAKDFASEPADKKVIAFESGRSAWTSGMVGVGGLAVAAACVALVLVNRAPDSTNAAAPSANASVAVAPPATPVQPAVVAAPVSVQPAVAENIPTSAIARTVTVPARHTEVKPLFATAPLGQTVVNPDAAAMLAAVQQNAQAQLDWIRTMQLAPMQALSQEELRLDPRSPLQPAARTYTTSGRPMEGTVQRSAFQFQK